MNKEIWPNKCGSAHEIHVSWLYYGDITIRDIFVYQYILGEGVIRDFTVILAY